MRSLIEKYMLADTDDDINDWGIALDCYPMQDK